MEILDFEQPNRSKVDSMRKARCIRTSLRRRHMDFKQSRKPQIGQCATLPQLPKARHDGDCGDWRASPSGLAPDYPDSQDEGCGSSYDAAPWAIYAPEFKQLCEQRRRASSKISQCRKAIGSDLKNAAYFGKKVRQATRHRQGEGFQRSKMGVRRMRTSSYEMEATLGGGMLCDDMGRLERGWMNVKATELPHLRYLPVPSKHLPMASEDLMQAVAFFWPLLDAFHWYRGCQKIAHVVDRLVLDREWKARRT